MSRTPPASRTSTCARGRRRTRTYSERGAARRARRRGPRAERWARVLRDGEAIFVADEEGRVAAFVSVGPAHDDDQVGELYALPEAWGTGAGRTLIRAGVQACAEVRYRLTL